MQKEFKEWLIKRGYKETGAANSYSTAISQISRHYTEQTGQHIDIYSVEDQSKISELAHDYSQSGKFSAFGYEQHGRFRAAIARYSEFFVQKNGAERDCAVEKNQSEEILENELQQARFAYEKDLQTALCAQISELFPGYKIFGNANKGIEYAIDKRRIDVLLENIVTGDLCVVELKSGIADYKVYGQISMYIGLLQKEFPDKKITGIVVAGMIDESFRQACLLPEKIQVKLYRMMIELEDA